MPKTKVYLYKEGDRIPMVDWFDKIARKDKYSIEKCYGKIKILKEFGHELHRPHTDYLRDGIYELRLSFRRVQYRILYFSHGQNVIILSHGTIKEERVPDAEINRAIKHKQRYELEPETHTFEYGV